MAKRYDLLIRLLTLGDSGVGKTCMIRRFTEDIYHEDYVTTIGIDFYVKHLEIEGKKVRIQLWDTAGQEKFETLTRQYYRRTEGIFLVYDITNERSFENLQKWLGYVREYARDDVQLMVLANKCDKENDRVLDAERGQTLARELDVPFYETSAKEADNIERAFVDLARRVMHEHKKEFDAIRLEREDSDSGDFVSELLKEKSQQSQCCS